MANLELAGGAKPMYEQTWHRHTPYHDRLRAINIVYAAMHIVCVVLAWHADAAALPSTSQVRTSTWHRHAHAKASGTASMTTSQGANTAPGVTTGIYFACNGSICHSVFCGHKLCVGSPFSETP